MRRLFANGKFAKNTDGVEMVEFALVLLPAMAFIILLLDIAWFIFAKASLQFAVREGTRYAITGRTSGSSGQDASIDAIVQQNAFGFLSGSSGLASISINYYLPTTLADAGTGASSNAGGNVVVVAINNVPIVPLIPWPVWGSGMAQAATIAMSAQSSDVVEGSALPPSR